ncbi:MAG TPA: response regulator [Nitrospinota bacterium]|nr:response regulator [Nitrospinota bacterium]
MSKKILLADDSVTIQKIVEITFQEEDFEVCVVGNGLDALQKVKGDRPDIILADISMPGLNGIDLCEKLKSDSQYKDIPFILLTNSFEEFDKKKGDKIGVNGYIEKPFESQDLLDMVQSLVEEKVSDLEEELGLELIDEEEKKEKIITSTPIESEDKDKLSEELKDITEITEEEISLEELTKEEELPSKQVEEEPPKEEKEITKEKTPQEDILSLKKEREEEVIEKEQEQDIFKPPTETKVFEKFEPKEEIKDFEEERLDLKELDQVLGRYLRNLLETTFKSSLDQMTPRINEIVEKVTKEMVPGIAESIIKKEIEKLKSSADQ